MKPLKFIFIIFFANIFCDNSIEREMRESSICENNDPVRDVAFVRIGRYNGYTDKGSEYQKTYLVSRYAKTTWMNAKTYCKSFDLDLVSFETLTEVYNFIDMAKENSFVKSLGGVHMLVDGMTPTPNTTTEWYWTNTGTKVSFTLPWQEGEPNFLNNGEYCLALSAHEVSTLGFNDFPCDVGLSPFVCQRADFYVPLRAN
ncbi:unnamed protein product [Chironomus riparius]|uniref:C-type lectin domain-containing protein n=1 Tax=Chironomus riparius TaxID=315576 RepID=A0A9N9S199_9DIPT|nr:unnamed protein product [Chironomus riparius]